jgi:hypothetical protein
MEFARSANEISVFVIAREQCVGICNNLKSRGHPSLIACRCICQLPQEAIRKTNCTRSRQFPQQSFSANKSWISFSSPPPRAWQWAFQWINIAGRPKTDSCPHGSLYLCACACLCVGRLIRLQHPTWLMLFFSCRLPLRYNNWQEVWPQRPSENNWLKFCLLCQV